MIEGSWVGLVAAAAGLVAGWWLRSRRAEQDRVHAETERRREIERAQSELAAAGRELERLAGTERELRRDLDASATTIDALRTEIESHTRGLKEARQSREALRQQTAQLTGELETAKARWAEASSAVEGLAERDREVRMLTESIAGIAGRLDQAIAARNVAEADRTRAVLQLETLAQQVRDTAAAARADRERADASRTLQAAAITDLKRQLSESVAAKASTELERAADRHGRTRAEQRAAELEARIRQSEVAHQQALADLQADLGSARAQAERLEPLRRQVEDREALVRSIARERDDATAGLIRRERELLDSVEALQTRIGELLRLEPALRRAEADLEQARVRLAEVERERGRIHTAQERAAAQIASLRSEVRDRDARFRLLLTDRRATVEASQGEVARLKDMVSASRRRGAGPSDDLKRISGIGPSLERILRKQGVHSFRQIALWTEADIERISGELGVFRNRIQRDGWIDQARREHERAYGEPVEQ